MPLVVLDVLQPLRVQLAQLSLARPLRLAEVNDLHNVF
jgi:hypothetical protein